MGPVEIYTAERCPFCVRAKTLMDEKGVAYRELRVDREPGLREEAMERSGGMRTVPQIFVGGVHVGGFQELAALDREGRLDSLLSEHGIVPAAVQGRGRRETRT